jgi:hypothetical protein
MSLDWMHGLELRFLTCDPSENLLPGSEPEALNLRGGLPGPGWKLAAHRRFPCSLS